MVCGASLRRADLRVLNRKADPMKRCFCYLLALVLGALAVGGLVFALLRSGVLTLTAGSSAALLFFAAAAAAGLGGLLAYLLGGLLATGRRLWPTPGSAAARPLLPAPWAPC